MKRFPDFIVIGAMKSGTSTLHEQLGRQPGIFMSRPQEPDFFSDDATFRRGVEWYQSLFAEARQEDLRGESSTAYSKLPTYDLTVQRMLETTPNVRLVYLMRHPVERLVSQYIHEWTENRISCSIDEAIHRYSELVDYGRYAMQLEPYVASFGKERILPVFFEFMKARPQRTLEAICDFIGYRGEPTWDTGLRPQNVSRERMRKSVWRDAIVYAPLLSQVRRWLVPQRIRDRIKQLWKMTERPHLSPASLGHVTALFDQDLANLGEWLGVELSCANFATVGAAASPGWHCTGVGGAS